MKSEPDVAKVQSLSVLAMARPPPDRQGQHEYAVVPSVEVLCGCTVVMRKWRALGHSTALSTRELRRRVLLHVSCAFFLGILRASHVSVVFFFAANNLA